MDIALQGAFAGARAYAWSGGRAFDAALPATVFIHGAQHDHSVWSAQSSWFAEHGHAVLALDLPGHGRTPGPALDSVEAMADWLLAVLDAAGAGPALLAGHSMGALVALEAAARAPARVRALALLGVAWPMQVSDALLASARDDEARAIDTVNLWSHGAPLAPTPPAPAPGFSMIGVNRRLMQRMAARNPDRLLYTDLKACKAYAGGAEAAAGLHCPAMFVLGRLDMMTPPRVAQTLIGAVPQAEVVHVDAGHAMMAEQSATVRAALADFAACTRTAD